MSVSERINHGRSRPHARVATMHEHLARGHRNRLNRSNGLGDFKSRVHDALFERLGMRLFEAKNEAEMQSFVSPRSSR